MEQTNNSILNFPEEVFYSIVIQLPVVDIFSLARTCKKANRLIKDNDCLWMTLIKRDFDLICKDCEKGTLILLYRELVDTYCVITKTFKLDKKNGI